MAFWQFRKNCYQNRSWPTFKGVVKYGCTVYVDFYERNMNSFGACTCRYYQSLENFANPPDFFCPLIFIQCFDLYQFFKCRFSIYASEQKTCVFAISHAKSRFNSNIRLGESILVICTKQRLWPTVSFCRNGKKRFHNMARMTAMHRYKFIDMRGIFPF